MRTESFLRHVDQLEVGGFGLRAGAIGELALVRLLDACVPAAEAGRVRHPSGQTYGIRGLLWSSATLGLELEATGLTEVARDVVGHAAFPIDAIFFDKHANANWIVPGHQDRLMPIASGSGRPKSVRNAVAYAEPSPQTLAQLVALRRLGILSAEAIRNVPLTDYHPCGASRGDVLILRPVLLHRSGRRVAGGQRRVLHVVYATEHPTGGLRWKSS